MLSLENIGKIHSEIVKCNSPSKLFTIYLKLKSVLKVETDVILVNYGVYVIGLCKLRIEHLLYD